MSRSTYYVEPWLEPRFESRLEPCRYENNKYFPEIKLHTLDNYFTDKYQESSKGMFIIFTFVSFNSNLYIETHPGAAYAKLIRTYKNNNGNLIG